ncbi:MAG: response regulator, partial [Myxococcota bacterium]
QHRHVDVVGENLAARTFVHALHLGKAADGEPFEELPLQAQAGGIRKECHIRRHLGALVAEGLPALSYGAALAVEPATLLACAALALRTSRSGETTPAQRLLAPGFFLLAVATTMHLGWLSQGEVFPWSLVAFWVAITPPLLGIQIQAAADRDRQLLERVRDRLEENVKERTSELAEANASLRQEIAERQSVEEALRESEERYRTVTELSSDFAFAFLIDPKLGFTLEWMSDQGGRLTGLSPAEAARRGWLSQLHPEDRARAAEVFQAVRSGELRELEYRIFHSDGRLRWIQLQLATVQTRSDGSIRIVGAARDITDRKEAEEERRQLEQRMHEARRLESLGVLTGGIAHDFNNLFTVILGNVRLCQEEPEGSDLENRLGRIKSAAGQAATLTEQMLLYAGEPSTSTTPCDLAKEVEETLAWLRGTIPERCRIETTLGPGLPLLAGDPPQLRRMVANLVTNAFEALGEEPGVVSLRTRQVQAHAEDLRTGHGANDALPGPYLSLEVSDTGAGMDADVRARILEPFFTTKFSGRGLGLASVLGIVRAHHGVLFVDSEPGRGTTVRVLLPVPKVGPQNDASGSAQGGRRGRVLVVDDEAWVLELTREFLERAGYEVLTARGGREGLDRLRAAGDDVVLVILDLTMPDLDGARVLREMKRLRPELPVVLATGHSPESTSRQADLSDAAGFLKKPYEPEILLEEVGRLVAL